MFCQQILTKHLSKAKLKTLGTGETSVLSTAVVYACLRDHVNMLLPQEIIDFRKKLITCE